MKNKLIGSLIGLAVGDAVGTTNEFKRREDVGCIVDMVGGGPFHLNAGEWTDDTSMALCLAQSLIEKGFDQEDQLKRYVSWWHNGYMSHNEICFDIGTATENALSIFEKTGQIIAPSNENLSGNGGIMRLAPVAIKYHDSLYECKKYSVLQSQTTHASDLSTSCALILGVILYNCYHNTTNDKNDVLNVEAFLPFEKIQPILNKSYIYMTFDQVGSRGFCVDTLMFAIWCFYHTSNFKDCIHMASFGGGDSDTNAAVAGQIAGAYYGYDSIPEDWQRKLKWHDFIYETAVRLIDN